jgi:ABC-type glycerol-3-phosphate transport system substrate-binding protein
MIGSVVTTGLLVFLIINNIKPKANDLPGGGKKDIFISVWGVDSSSAFSQVSEDFEKLRPGVDVSYKQFREETFEDELLSALAAGIGPDIIMVKNRSLSRLQNKLLPLNQNQLSITKFREYFPTVAEQDFVDSKNGLIYALPLYIDTLAFLYDRDAFDKAGVLSFPTTWEKLSQDAIKLRELSPNGQLIKSSIALGGSNRTVINGSDLLVLLMMQYGANFNQGTIRADAASGNAFNFYLQFSNPASPFYSWSETFGSSFDSFIGHKTSIIPIYFSQLSKLLAKDPFLRYQVASMAQLKSDTPINYADYWGLAVIRQSKNSALAWDFARYVTTQPVNADAYARKTNRPPAMKTLLQANFEDPIKGIFARQALTARSWPGPNDFTVRQIISNNILAYMRGEVNITTALDTIEFQIKQVAGLK